MILIDGKENLVVEFQYIDIHRDKKSMNNIIHKTDKK